MNRLDGYWDVRRYVARAERGTTAAGGAVEIRVQKHPVDRAHARTLYSVLTHYK